jgi:DNA-binding MarR family transcriptional regulator
LTESVGFLLSKAAHKIHNLHMPAFEQFDVQPKQYGILSLLKVHDHLSQIEISRALMIDRSTMVSLVDDLEKKHLAIRTRDTKDRRAYSLALTPKGKNLLEKLSETLFEIEARYLKVLSQKDADRLRRALMQLILQNETD